MFFLDLFGNVSTERGVSLESKERLRGSEARSAAPKVHFKSLAPDSINDLWCLVKPIKVSNYH